MANGKRLVSDSSILSTFDNRSPVGGVLLSAALALMTAVLPGCAKRDNRIDLATLRQLERLHIEKREVIEEVPLKQIALTDVRPYQFGVEDELLIEVTGLHEEIYRPERFRVRVRPDGNVTLPGIGEIQVAGRSAAELERAVTDAFVPGTVKRSITVFVELLRPHETTVLVTGAAKVPGLVRLRENQRNVLYALAAANGFVEGSTGAIRVVPARPERPEVTYNLRDEHDVRAALLAPPLESGDTVVVTTAEPSVVYMTGLVYSPGPVPVPRNEATSLVRIISAAGGLVDFLEPQEATLWRRMEDGRQVRVKLDLEAIMEGQAPDIPLLAGDVLDVPHTAHTRFRQWVAGNIRLGPFGVTAVYDPVADYRARVLRNDDDDNVFEEIFLNSLGTGLTNVVVSPVTP